MRIEHVAIYVEDLEKIREFFEEYFDAKANDKYHNKTTGLQTYFLSFKEGSRLEIMTRPNLLENHHPHPYRFGYTHLAFQLGSKEAVDTLTERLVNDGYVLNSGPRVTGDGYYESSLLLIENIEIELMA